MMFFIRNIMLALLVLVVPRIVQADSLRITAENYPPYSYEVNGHAEGFVSNIVHVLMGQVGEPYSKITFYPWARAYQNIQSGLSDVLFPMARSSKRSNLFKFVGPIFSDKVFFYRKKNTDIAIKNIADAKQKYRIAVTRDDLYHQVLREKGFVHLDVSSNQNLDFLKLLKGRVDLVPMGERAIHGFFEKYPELDDSMFEKIGPVLFTSDTYIAFAAHVPDAVVQRWQEALDTIKDNGVYQFIIDYYFEQNKDNYLK